tara:strand:- start:29577 stop:30461 length:885 start_codon:yes stop_codon:yes gene_type:complete
MVEKWLEISIDAPNEFVEPVCQIFSKYSNNKIAIIESPIKNYGLNLQTVKCWIDYSSSNASLELIDISIKLINYLHPIGEIKKKFVDENMWNKQEFSSISIGKKLMIIPNSISNYDESKILIPLIPGLAFGTGHHPTTRMCLESLENNLNKDDSVLDLGSGSGILSIASFMLGASKVISMDIDDDSIKSTRRNISLANIKQNTLILKSSLPNVNVPCSSQDIIVANISSEIIISLSKMLLHAVKSTGLVIVSGILDEKISDVIKSFCNNGGRIINQKKINDWNLLEVKKNNEDT